MTKKIFKSKYVLFFENQLYTNCEKRTKSSSSIIVDLAPLQIAIDNEQIEDCNSKAEENTQGVKQREQEPSPPKFVMPQ